MRITKEWHVSKEVELVQEIEAAFTDTQYPGDNAIVPLYENQPHCPECAGLANNFRGKTWRSISLETLAWERSSLPPFTDQAFQYYLPAFLRAALLHRLETDTLWENIFYTLTPPEEATGREMASFVGRINGFNAGQKAVLKEYMRFYLETETSYDVPGKKRVREFWGLDNVELQGQAGVT